MLVLFLSKFDFAVSCGLRKPRSLSKGRKEVKLVRRVIINVFFHIRMSQPESTAFFHVQLSNTGDTPVLVFIVNSRFDEFDGHKGLAVVILPMYGLFTLFLEVRDGSFSWLCRTCGIGVRHGGTRLMLINERHKAG